MQRAEACLDVEGNANGNVAEASRLCVAIPRHIAVRLRQDGHTSHRHCCLPRKPTLAHLHLPVGSMSTICIWAMTEESRWLVT